MRYFIERKEGSFYFSVSDGRIEVWENRINAETKSMKIEPCNDYVFCALKTKIKAIGGAAGVERFLCENLKPSDTFSCRAWNLIKHVHAYGK